MSRHRRRSVQVPDWLRRLRWLILPVGLFAMFASAGLLYAAHTENNDAFCASCHTHPESDFYQRSQQQPVDLASVHTTYDVTCIQCHSGPGVTGRLSAMAGVAAPDLAHYVSGHYHAPAIVTVPISDANCIKCHQDVITRRDFQNHFHYFLPQWQAMAPGTAATCVDCHQSHVTGATQDTKFLLDGPTRQVCQNCHSAARAG